MTPAGFPHSDISGSQDACSSPELFAACHVLPRLAAPRHSPCALTALGLSLLPTNATTATPRSRHAHAYPRSKYFLPKALSSSLSSQHPYFQSTVAAAMQLPWRAFNASTLIPVRQPPRSHAPVRRWVGGRSAGRPVEGGPESMGFDRQVKGSGSRRAPGTGTGPRPRGRTSRSRRATRRASPIHRSPGVRGDRPC